MTMTDHVIGSWYLAGMSSRLSRARVLTREMFGRHVALFRGHDGRVRAVEEAAPGVLPFAYPIEECHGCLFVFAGPRPSFPLPSFEFWSDEELLVSRFAPRLVEGRPQDVLARFLDVSPLAAVRQLELVSEPGVRAEGAHRVQVRLQMKLRLSGRLARLLRWIDGMMTTVTLTTWGANMATLEGWVGPLPLLAQVALEPSTDGRSLLQAFLFAPRSPRLPRILHLEHAVLFAARLAVRFILSRRPTGFAAAGESDPAGPAVAAFTRQVNAMPLFDPQAPPAADGDAGLSLRRLSGEIA